MLIQWFNLISKAPYTLPVFADDGPFTCSRHVNTMLVTSVLQVLTWAVFVVVRVHTACEPVKLPILCRAGRKTLTQSVHFVMSCAVSLKSFKKSGGSLANICTHCLIALCHFVDKPGNLAICRVDFLQALFSEENL